MENEEVRNCEQCKHFKNYKDDLFACEKWECEYEPKEGEAE